MTTTIKLLSMQPKFRLLAMTFSVILFSFVTNLAHAQSTTTVTTDKLDYPPGDTVKISGTGFQPGETVTLQVTHVGDGDNDVSGVHAPWTVVANSDGTISAFWVVPPDQDELGATLKLTADGQSSGLHAEVLFTDASNSGTVTITAPLCAQGGSFRIAYTPPTGSIATEDHLTPFTVTVRKNTTYTITLIASNVNGNTYSGTTSVSGTTPNSSDFTQTVTLQYTDNTAPSLTGTAYTQSGSISGCEPSQSDAAGAFSSTKALQGYSDNCSSSLTATLTQTDRSGNDQSWTITYTYTVSDGNGNSLTGQQYSESGGDVTAPSLTGTAYTQSGSISGCEPSQSDAAGAFSSTKALQGYSDNCSSSLTATLTQTDRSGNDQSWTITYTYTVSDGNGNSLTGQQYSESGGDVTAPSLTGTAYTQSGSISGCEPSQSDAAGAFSSTKALQGYSDNCSSSLTATLTQTDRSGNDQSWTITYTYTVSDGNGNSLTGQQYSESGGDVTAPSLTGTAYTQSGSISGCEPSQSDAAGAFSSTKALQGYSDNCSSSLTATLTQTDRSGNDQSWTITYTYTVSDGNGNSLTGQQYSESGGDVTAPSLTGTAYTQSGSISGCEPSQSDAAGAFSSTKALQGYSDNCSSSLTATLTQTDRSGNDQSWTITYTYTVSDGNGNSLTGQQYSESGGDVTAPSLTGTAYTQSGSISGCEPSQSDAAGAFSSTKALQGYSDNCSSSLTATLTQTDRSGNDQSWTITYTYTVSDGNGNSLTGQQYSESGGDVTAPSLTGTAYTQSGSISGCEPSQSDAAGAFSSTKALQGYSDNCSSSLTATLTQTDRSGNDQSWTITYTYTVSDGNGNSLTGQQYSESGGDVTAPSLTGTAYTQSGSISGCEPSQSDAAGAFSSTKALQGYSDNCSSSLTATLTQTDRSGNDQSWTITYTYTVSDGNGNSLTGQQYSESGGDVTAPSLTGTAYTQSGSISGCEPSQSDAAGAFSSTKALQGYSDNCSSSLTATLTQTDRSGNDQSWTITYTYTVSDGNGNSLTGQQYSESGGDVTAPSLTGTAYTQSGSISGCEPSQSDAAGAFSSTKALQGYSDNCSSSLTATLTQTDRSGNDQSWTITYTYTVSDGNGNSLTGQQYSESGGDVTAPSLTGTAYTQSGSISGCEPSQSDAAGAFSSTKALQGYSDNCSSSLTATLTQTDRSGNDQSWTITYTYTVSDGNGNSLTGQQYSESGGDVTAPSLTGTAYTQSGSISGCEPSQSDAAGAFSSTKALQGYSDNCSSSLTATLTQTDRSGNDQSWTITYTYTVSDGNGNSLTGQQYSESGGDVTAPSLTGTAYTQSGSISGCEPSQSDAAGAFSSTKALQGYSDNCSSSLTATLTQTDRSGNDQSWTITYTYTVSDGNGNSLTGQQYSESGGDVTAPSLTGTAYTQSGSISGCEPSQSDAAGAFSSTKALQGYSDNCSSSLTATLTQTDRSGNDQSWTITYTYTVSDGNGNSLTGQQYSESGGDVTAPSLTGTAYTQSGSISGCEPSQSDAAGAFSSTKALQGYSDNCSSSLTATLTQTDRSGNDQSWTITYTYTVSDGNGNSLTGQQYSESGGDVTAPSLTGTAYTQSGSISGCEPSQSDAAGAFSSTKALQGYSDNCSSSLTATLTQTDRSGNDQSWTITYTYTVSDGNGNSLTGQQYSESGGDVTAPSLTGTAYTQSGSISGCEPSQSDAAGAFSSTKALQGYSDNCSSSLTATLTQTDRSGNDQSWTITYTYTVSDGNGNSLTGQQYSESGGDVTAPSLTGTAYTQSGSISGCEPSQSDAAGAFSSTKALQGYSDNCSSSLTATLTQTDRSGNDQSWTITYTYTVSDGNGNSLTGQQYSESGGDVTAPSLTGTAYTQSGSISGCEPSQSDAAGAFSSTKALQGYSDNCSSSLTATLTQTDRSGNDQSWTITYTYTVSDGNGNSLTGQQYSESGGDVTAPSLTGTAYTQSGSISGCEPSQSDAAGAFSSTKALQGYSDNCSSSLTATLTQTDRSGNDQSWTITYTYTVSDGNGNSLTGQQYSESGGDVTAPSLTGTAYTQSGSISGCEPSQSDAAGAFSSTKALQGYSDNCSSSLTATLTQTDRSGNDQSWTITYTYTVSDGNGNSLTGQQYSESGGDVTAPSLTGTAYTQSGSISGCEPSQSDAAGAFSSTKALQGYSDNCSSSLTATLTQTDRSGNDQSWTITYTYTVSDGNGNSLTGQQYSESGGDVTAPSLTGTAYTQSGSISGCEPSQSDAAGAFSSTKALQGYSDNCSSSLTATLTQTDRSGNDQSWKITYTYTVSDGNGNSLTGQQYSESGGDVTAPVFTVTNTTVAPAVAIANNSTINLIYDPAICGAVFNFAISADDNCAGAVIPQQLLGQLSGTTFPIGETLVKYSAQDPSNNVSYFQFTVKVNKAPTISTLDVAEISPSPTRINGLPTQQYSDKVRLTVTVSKGASSCANGQAASSVNFYIAGVKVNSIPVPLSSDGDGNLSATGDYALLASYANACGANPKSVTAELLDKNTNYFTVNDPSPKQLNIIQEDADVDYTGTTFISTAYNTVDVLLSASVKDVVDNYPGDIRTAKVKFKITDYQSTTTIKYESAWITVNLANPNILTEGYVVDQWKGAPVPTTAGDQNQYNVYVYVDCDGTAGNYKAQVEPAALSIFRTATIDFITGGGYITPTNCLGSYAAANNRKINFGFNIRWNKSFKNLQGKLNVVYRRGSRVYQVKTTATNGLAIDGSNICLKKAVFTAKANLTDVTDPLNPIPILSGLTLELKLTDNNLGGADSWALTLYDGTTLVFSSQWSSGTVELPLGGGNVVVHSGTDCPNANNLNSYLVSREISKGASVADNVDVDSNIKAYPNPTTSQFNIKLHSSNTTDAINIIVYDVNGKVVEQRRNLAAGQTIQLGASYRPGIYILEMIRGTEHKQLKLVKIPD